MNCLEYFENEELSLVLEPQFLLWSNSTITNTICTDYKRDIEKLSKEK